MMIKSLEFTEECRFYYGSVSFQHTALGKNVAVRLVLFDLDLCFPPLRTLHTIIVSLCVRTICLN